MTLNQILVLIAVLLYSIFDPLRDYKKSGKVDNFNISLIFDKSWWQWHLIKWVSIYPVLACLTLTYFSILNTLYIAVGSWIIWNASLRIFTPANWIPWLIQVFIWLFKMIFGLKVWRGK